MGLRNLVGGELPEYTELIAESRDMAVERMTHQADSLGANAIVAAVSRLPPYRRARRRYSHTAPPPSRTDAHLRTADCAKAATTGNYVTVTARRP